MQYYTLLTLFISKFKDVLNGLHFSEGAIQQNRVIGGSIALSMHGLFIGRQPEDMDLIIYNPSPAQLEYIRNLAGVKCSDGESPLTKSSIALRELRSFKLIRNDKTLNILLEHFINAPEQLLTFNFDNVFYRIQSIENVIAAKNSYGKREEVKGSTGQRFIRQKDAYDCQQLKSLNFNIPMPPQTVQDQHTDSDYGEGEEIDPEA